MKICKKCGNEFPSYITIDGKSRNLCNRKYCFDCSPYGKHNTKKLDGSKLYKTHKCKCGETDPLKFYGHKKSICGKCHNKYTIQTGKERREFAINLLGGKCRCCGYSKYIGALDIHHLDTNKKDINFASLRGWKEDRIKRELQNCVALCANCHREVHANITSVSAVW